MRLKRNIEFMDLDLWVEAECTPAEQADYTYGGGNPASPEEIIVTSIKCGEVDMSKFFMNYLESEGMLEEIIDILRCNSDL